MKPKISPYINNLRRPSYGQNSTKSKKFRISHEKLQSFWSSPMLLPARQVWYRVLANKIPHGLAMPCMQVIDSSLCRLCYESEDDFTHFVVSCPVKLDIWYSVLHKQYPVDNIPLEALLSSLCRIKFPNFIKTNAAKSKYYTIISTIQYCIWTHFWKHTIDGVPFNPTNVQQTINRNIDILLNPIDSD
ncbi:hypothetical protein BD770DRAFT_416333 [Pilaira anomala]|nr:hypothetical protein BD770DRAFT_416333 [Pilaira anomala]